MAANKCDLIDSERVSEERAREFAKEIGAIFKLTSASTSIGIEELFIGVGCKFLDPNYKEDENKKPVAKVITDNDNVIEERQEKEPEQSNQTNQTNQTSQTNQTNQSNQAKPANNKVVVTEKKENAWCDTIKLDPNVAKKKKKKKFC